MIDSIQGGGEMLKMTPRILFQQLDGDARHYDKEYAGGGRGSEGNAMSFGQSFRGL